MKDNNKLLIEKLEALQRTHKKDAFYYKNCFMTCQVMILILGVLSPLSILFCELMELSRVLEGQLLAANAVLIMILALINLQQKPKMKWIHHRANHEILKKEKYFYKFGLGLYQNLEQKEADDLLNIVLKKDLKINVKEL